MCINFNSEADCRYAYLDYYCYGNNLNTDAATIGRICTQWEDELASWQNSVSADSNAYDFEGDPNDYSKTSYEKQEEANDCDKNDGSWRTAGDATVSAGGAVCSAISRLGGGAWSWKTACVTASAVGAAYHAFEPNKETKAAIENMATNELPAAQSELTENQDEMIEASEEVSELSDEATKQTEDSNKKMEEDKAKYDMYKQIYDGLKSKVDAGEQLTADEKELYQNVVGYLTECGASMEENTDKVSNEVNDIYDDMDGYTDVFKDAAENIASAKGTLDYAKDIGNAGKNQNYVEIGTHGLNIASAGSAVLKGSASVTAKIATCNWGGAAIDALFVTLGLAGGIASYYAVSKENEYLAKAEAEVANAESTEAFRTEVEAANVELTDFQQSNLDSVEDLEFEIPDDVETPTDTELPPDQPLADPSVNNGNGNNQNNPYEEQETV